MRDWRAIFTGLWGGGYLDMVDQALATQTSRPLPSSRHDDEDDDDLDFIERAARKALHDNPNADDAEQLSSLEAKVRRLAERRPIAAEVVEDIIDGLLKEDE